jgi:putative membrane protein
MIAAALLSTFHLFALAIGVPGVVLRGVALRGLEKGDESAFPRLFAADAAWGVAALLWLGTGLARAFGPFEKSSAYYLHSGPFLIKMGLYVAIVLIEIWPMITFIRWRVARAKQQPIDRSIVPRLRLLNDLEVVLTLAIPFCASLMARGVGFGLFDHVS